MPIVVSNEGWVKVPQKRSTRPAKPVDPVDLFRGPLAYITGRPEFNQPVKKQPIKQLMLKAATVPALPPPPIPVIVDEVPDVVKSHRSSRTRGRVSSEAALVKSSKHKALVEVFEEADEEIIRPELHPQDSQSQRSASPAASRHSRAAPSTRSRRHVSASQPVYDDDQDNHRHNRSRRHASSSHSVYSEDRPDDNRHHHRSSRSERSYREPSYRERSRERERYYPPPMPQPSHYPYHYTPHAPPVQPIVIYSTPAPAIGCGGHHSCHGGHSQPQCYTSQPKAVLGIAAPTTDSIPSAPPRPVVSALPEPRPARSEISSVSTGSTRSKAMSYKWYTATQPLMM